MKKTIRESLGLAVNESYVATSKKFEIKTENLSTANKEAHLKLYEEYVAAFNQTSAQLDTADRAAAGVNLSSFRDLKRAETFNMNAVYLHELYFANIGKVESGLHTDSLAYMRLSRDFGDFEKWQDDFIACSVSSKEGWVVTAFSTFLRRYINIVVDGHDSGVLLGCYPVLVVDMWSHAYYKDYLSNKDKYIRKMMSELNWDTIENRIIRADKIGEALS